MMVELLNRPDYNFGTESEGVNLKVKIQNWRVRFLGMIERWSGR